jgi:glycosyltransferase involved in cell wall biosynthesis
MENHNEKTLVSVIMTAYNHAKFIRQSIESVLMQKTNFRYELIIHDDASTDGTTDIIREYERKFPNIIRAFYQTENQYSKIDGVKLVKMFVFPHVKGKYCVNCDGDDYICDSYKLQKEFDFLENHPDFSICFHLAEMVWEDGSNPNSI